MQTYLMLPKYYGSKIILIDTTSFVFMGRIEGHTDFREYSYMIFRPSEQGKVDALISSLKMSLSLRVDKDTWITRLIDTNIEGGYDSTRIKLRLIDGHKDLCDPINFRFCEPYTYRIFDKSTVRAVCIADGKDYGHYTSTDTGSIAHAMSKLEEILKERQIPADNIKKHLDGVNTESGRYIIETYNCK